MQLIDNSVEIFMGRLIFTATSGTVRLLFRGELAVAKHLTDCS